MTRSDYLLFGARATALRGNDLPHAKLNSDLVREIRLNREGLTARQFGERLGVHLRTVEKVRARESWGHV